PRSAPPPAPDCQSPEQVRRGSEGVYPPRGSRRRPPTFRWADFSVRLFRSTPGSAPPTGEPMPASITCSSCQTRLKAPDSTGGKTIRCPRCSAVVRVPAQPPAATARPAAPAPTAVSPARRAKPASPPPPPPAGALTRPRPNLPGLRPPRPRLAHAPPSAAPPARVGGWGGAAAASEDGGEGPWGGELEGGADLHLHLLVAIAVPGREKPLGHADAGIREAAACALGQL